MKLKTKLTVFSVLLIIVAIAVCCAILISFAQQREMQDVVESGLEVFRSVRDGFARKAGENTPSQPFIKRSFLVSRFFSLTDSDEFTLRVGDEYLINNSGYDIENLIFDGAAFKESEDGKTQYKIVRIGDADYFIAHATVELGPEVYDVSYIHNIFDTTKSIRTLTTKCVFSGSAITLIAAVIMWLIVDRAMKPIQKLKDSAAELAQGNYRNRIAIDGRDELAELAADFNSMAEAIETNIDALHDRSQRQQAFINDLSHELKTPITSILLCAETLLHRKVAPDTLHRSLERIYDQGKWLESLSQKLMALVMLQGEIALRPESVARLLDAVAETTADALQEQGMELSIECSMDLLPMDFDLLRSALVNLVVNAARASSTGQTIEIHAHDQAIEVIDHGKGIPPEEVDRVREPFYMVDGSRNKKQGGAGLGLALVGRIADAYGARLEIASAVNQGTAVRIQFGQPK